MKLPPTDEVDGRIAGHIEAEEWIRLEEYMESLWPLLMRAASRAAKPRRVAFPVQRAYEELAYHYARKADAARSEETADAAQEQQAKQRLKRLQERAFELATEMEWWDELQHFCWVWGEVYRKLDDWDTAERLYQKVVAHSGNEETSLWGLQRLGEVWERRDLSMAAYFYRWAAEFAGSFPVIEYAELYCCLIRAGRREEVLGEIRECEQSQANSVLNLIRLAAAKQALGLKEEAEAHWEACVRLINTPPGIDVPINWQHLMKIAKEVHCDDPVQ